MQPPKMVLSPVFSQINKALQTLLWLVALFGTFITITGAKAADKPAAIPSPLAIGQAIEFAGQHPRLKLGFQEQLQFPASQPVFMHCDRLAFTDTKHVDNTPNDTVSKLVSPLQQQQLQILQAFFDVLLADLNNAFINEKMASSYVEYDRAKNRFELKQISERVVERLNNKYQTVLQQFRASEATQRITRSVLAEALNHPEQLPHALTTPKLPGIPAELPDIDTLYQHALKNNTWLNTLTEQFPDKNKQADKAAFKQIIQMSLRQQLLHLSLRLQVLKTARQRAKIENNLRELNLDMSRALYDMEVKADLGNAMTLHSKAMLQNEQISYCQYLSWAQLNALQGKALLTPAHQGGKDPQ